MSASRPLAGRTCVVTGATSGIGREAALELARLGGTVAVVGRNARRCRDVVGEIAKLGGAPATTFVADLASLAEVRALAAAIVDQLQRVHVLVNNAAVVPRRRETSADGHEMQLAVNHLAPFLLTRLLLDRLRASAPARIVNVASQVHYQGAIHWDDPGFARGYDPATAYNQSKLANVMFTLALARRLEGTGVTANCVHPGVIGTRLLNDLFGESPLMLFRTRRNHAPVTVGARSIAHVAASPDLEGVSGRYYKEVQEQAPSAAAADVALQERLWSLSEQLVGLGSSSTG